MNIKPGGTAGLNLAYAVGFFAEDDSYVVTQLGGDSPFGSTLAALGSDYAVHISPDGAGWSVFAGLDITSPLGNGKGWYIRDRESGFVWSPFYLPVGEKADEYEVAFFPGQVTAFTLKNKIAASLTVAVLPNKPVEVWLVRLENRSARERSLSFTTYFEPRVGQDLEIGYRMREKLLLMRKSLSSPTDAHIASDMVLFHTSTLVPARIQTDKMRFMGQGRSLRNPLELDEAVDTQPECSSQNPLASFTVEIDLPIEGEAEFGFCVGVAHNANQAVELAKGLSRTSLIKEAVQMARMKWENAFSRTRLDSPDRVLNALVNTWLPYEAYAGWMRERTGGVCLDPAVATDYIRRFYSICAATPDMARESIVKFASGLSLTGTYSPDSRSFASLSLSELVWLPLVVARYILETGDACILAEPISLADSKGSQLTMQDLCERILEICSASREDAGPMFLRASRAWQDILGNPQTDVNKDIKEPQPLHQSAKSSEELVLPRRIRYLLAISKVLAEPGPREQFEQLFSADGAPTSDCAVACAALSKIVEELLGVKAVVDGLLLQPRLPDSWYDYQLIRVLRGDVYKVHVKRSLTPAKGQLAIYVDGSRISGQVIKEFGDGQEHLVEVIFC
jgi:cellobiose phosphorylase